MKNRKSNLILAIPVIVSLVIVTVIEFETVRQTGHVVYPIDDPYIHMAMARHFAEDGVFGVSKTGFSATSSSPFWTLLLGVFFKITGNHESIPLLLNGFFGTILAFYWTRLLADRLKSAWAAAIVGTVFSFILPLPTLIVLGMEHTLHCLLMLMMLERASRFLEESDRRRSPVSLLLLTFLSILVRFETLFLVAPLITLFLAERNGKMALALAGGCALPLVTLGLINIHNGWFFFPTSVLLKSALSTNGWEQIYTIIERLYGQLFGAPHMAVLFILSATAMFSAWGRESITQRNCVWVTAFAAAMVLHCSLAAIGWFYRYESYLLAIGVVAVAPYARDCLQNLWNAIRTDRRGVERWIKMGGLAGLIALMPFPFYKQWKSIETLVPAMRNTNSQQIQMGLFLQKYYTGEAVLANDIGAINYLADIRCLDVMGLGSVEPIKAQNQNLWSPNFLHSWCAQHRVSVVMVYENWLRKILPPDWIKVGEWTVDEKVSVADSTVSFYALIPPDAERLRNNLKSFEAQLPNGVKLNRTGSDLVK